MRRLAQNNIVLPVTVFLIVALSAPALVIHHVHHIKVGEPEGHESATAGPNVDAPATFHETHIVSLLSGDSFNFSTYKNVVPAPHEFIATLAVVPVFSSAVSPSHIVSNHLRTPSRSSRDRCALFCSFLI